MTEVHFTRVQNVNSSSIPGLNSEWYSFHSIIYLISYSDGSDGIISQVAIARSSQTLKVNWSWLQHSIITIIQLLIDTIVWLINHGVVTNECIVNVDKYLKSDKLIELLSAIMLGHQHGHVT